MIVSSPRINLRRAASYTGHEKGPLSSTSSRFGFNHLLISSPPPSPGLPHLLPRRRKLSSTTRPSKVLRALLWILSALSLLYFAVSSWRRPELAPLLYWPRRVQNEYEMIGHDRLPDFPTPVMMTDRKGKARWTMYIPPNHGFPLLPGDYTAMTSQCREVSNRVDALHNSLQSSGPFHLGRESAQRHFMDVAEAETAGVLPGTVPVSALLNQQGQNGGLVGTDQEAVADQPVCPTSMTFALESENAGLGLTMMMLWVVYAISQSEGRAFFIDDTRWAYGRYTDIFETPPNPGCRPPLRHEIVPCPRHARHIVITTATARDLISEAAAATDASTRKQDFAQARQGYEALFRLNSEDAKYVSTRVGHLEAKARLGSNSAKSGLAVGLHVRRGDLHPLDFQYRGSYIPTSMYIERAREIINAMLDSRHKEDEMARSRSFLVLASDDPVVYDLDEFTDAARAQDRIRLASKTAIQAVNPDKHVMRKFVDETFGWEGGFFAAMFWNLGLPTLTAANAAKAAEARLNPSPETIRLRSLLGRSYMMDLAVLSEVSDVVVCTVSAMGCRLLAVMMGYEKAFEENKWINIDGEHEWSSLL